MLISEKKLRSLVRGMLLREQGVDTDTDTDDSDVLPDKVAIPPTKPKPIARGVRTNALIDEAWSYLSLYLPDGAYMSSGLRTQEDQDRIICDYASDEGIECDLNDSKSLDSAVEQLQKTGLAIGRYVSTKHKSHGAGDTFDITGANLNDIKRAVEEVSDNPFIPVKFAKSGTHSPPYSLVEPVNNAVHVIIEPPGLKVAAVRDD